MCIPFSKNPLHTICLSQEQEGGDVLIFNKSVRRNKITSEPSILGAKFTSIIPLFEYSPNKGKILLRPLKLFGKRLSAPGEVSIRVVLTEVVAKEKCKLNIALLRAGDDKQLATSEFNFAASTGAVSTTFKVPFVNLYDEQSKQKGFKISILRSDEGADKAKDDAVVVGDNNLSMIILQPHMFD